MTILKSFHTFRLLPAVALGALLAACGGNGEQDQQGQPTAGGEEPTTPGQAEVAQRMLDSLGGEAALRDIDTLVLEGSGTRNFLGQVPETGAPDGPGELPELTEVIDFANGRAAFDNTVVNSNGFGQERTDVLTTYEGEPVGLSTTNGRPWHVTSVDGLFAWATHNTPVTLLRRNVVTMALTASDLSGDEPVDEGTLEGEAVWELETTRDGEEVTLLVDQDDYLLRGWRVLDTETMRGDKQATYFLDDYQQVDQVQLPHFLRITRDGDLYAEITYQDIRVNDQDALAIFEIPSDVEEQAQQVVQNDGPWVSLEWNEVADGLVHVVAFSHHSMVVEFADFVTVVEAPYTEAQSRTLARMIEERIGKPIRHVVPTHPHYDHTGGIRAMVAMGADLMAAAGHEDELRMIIESPHTNPPDFLAEQREQGAAIGSIETYEGMTEISDDERTLTLYVLDNIPHVKPAVIALDEQTGTVFQSDLFMGVPSPDALALYEAIEERGLEVERIVGGHAGPFTYESLREAADNARQQDQEQGQE